VQIAILPRALGRETEEKAAVDPTGTLSLDQVAAELHVTRALLIRNRKKYSFVKRVSRKNFVVVESRYGA
jgi:hypothetical protein